MASNGSDIWIPTKVDWDKKRTIAFSLLGCFVIILTVKIFDKLFVRGFIFLLLLLAVFVTFPRKWPRFLAGFSIIVALVCFEKGLIDSLVTKSIILFFVLLTTVQTLPSKFHRLSTALSTVITLSQFFTVNLYDFIGENLDAVVRVPVIGVFLEGQVERAAFCSLAGSTGGLLTVGSLLLLVMLPSSEFVLALHQFAGVKRRDALRWLLSLMMGTQYPWQVVEDGEVTVTKPKGVFGDIGGPGVVVVRPGNAVVFEWGGEVTKIEGPGVYKTKRFERIKQVVDLRPQWATIEVKNLLTKDRVSLSFEVGVGYQIEPRQDTDRRIERAESEGKEFKWEYERGKEVIEGIYPVYKDSVFRAVYRVSRAGWQLIMRAIPDSFLRDIVIAYTLDQLYEPSEGREVKLTEELKESPRIIAEIEGRVKKKLEKVAISYGVRVGTFDIKSVIMPEEVRERVMEWWETEWKRKIALKEASSKKRAMIEKAEGRAWALERLEEVKAGARQAIIKQLVDAIIRIESDRPQTTVRFIHVIEQLSRRMMADDVLASHYCEVLEAIAQSGGQKVLILGEDRRLLERGDDTLRSLLETGALRALEPPGEDRPGGASSILIPGAQQKR